MSDYLQHGPPEPEPRNMDGAGQEAWLRRHPNGMAVGFAALLFAGAGGAAGAGVTLAVLADRGQLPPPAEASTPPSPSADPPAATAAPQLAEPSRCQVRHSGSPARPDTLLLDCGNRAWALVGPWPDREQRQLPTQANRGWNVEQAVVVGGDARVWYRDDHLTCLATRNLLDTATETRVRCRPVGASSSDPAGPRVAPVRT